MSSKAHTTETGDEHPHTGVFKGKDGHSGTVHTPEGIKVWLPNFADADSRIYRYGARLAFDVEGELETDSIVGPRINRVKFLGREYSYDAEGEVVYAHGGHLFVSVDGRSEDVKMSRGRLWNGYDTEVGDMVAFDWFNDRDSVRRGEVQ